MSTLLIGACMVVVGVKVFGCLLGGDLLLERSWMEVCRVGHYVVRGLRLRTGTAVGSYGNVFAVG